MSHRPQTTGPVHIAESLQRDVVWAWPADIVPGIYDQIQTDYPTSYWRAGDFTGTTIPDVAGAGFGNDAGIIGAVRTGRSTLTTTGNRALWLDGMTGGVIIPDTSTLDIGTGSKTWGVWFRADRATGTETLICKADAGNANGIVVSMDSAGTITALLHNTVTCTLAANARDARTHMLIVVYDRAAQELWMVYDGTPTAHVSTAAIGAANLSSTADLAYGCRYLGNVADQFFMGWIDELWLSSTPLGHDRAALHYRAGTSARTGFVGTGPVTTVGPPALYLIPGANAPQATGSGAFTLAATIVISATVTTSVSVCDMVGGSNLGGCGLQARSGALAWVEANNAASLTTVTVSRALTAGTTLRTVWVHANSLVACYVDGAAVGSMTASSWTAQNTIGIGGSPVLTTPFSYGLVRDVVLFGRALTAAEVVRLTAGTP